MNYENCEAKYIGKTRKNIRTSFKEHFSHLKYQREEKSSIVKHCILTVHIIKEENMKLLKHTRKKPLNAW